MGGTLWGPWIFSRKIGKASEVGQPHPMTFVPEGQNKKDCGFHKDHWRKHKARKRGGMMLLCEPQHLTSDIKPCFCCIHRAADMFWGPCPSIVTPASGEAQAQEMRRASGPVACWPLALPLLSSSPLGDGKAPSQQPSNLLCSPGSLGC